MTNLPNEREGSDEALKLDKDQKQVENKMTTVSPDDAFKLLSALDSKASALLRIGTTSTLVVTLIASTTNRVVGGKLVDPYVVNLLGQARSLKMLSISFAFIAVVCFFISAILLLRVLDFTREPEKYESSLSSRISPYMKARFFTHASLIGVAAFIFITLLRVLLQ